MNSKYDFITTNGELSHHGILGQRWGKRNGPPYPIDASDHSSSEKKAGWKKSLDKSESKASKGKVSTERSQSNSSANKKKMLKAGTIALGAALATYGAFKIGSDPEVRAAVNRGRLAISRAAKVMNEGKSNTFSSEQLKNMGIKVADVDRVNIDRVHIDRTN